MLKTPQRSTEFALFDYESWHRDGLRARMVQGGLTPMLSTTGDMRGLLTTLSEHQVFFAVITCVNRRGLQGYQWMMEQTSNLHALCPTLGILFVTDSSTPWRNDCLPSMVWVINEIEFDLSAMQSEIELQKTERSAQYRDTGLPSIRGLVSRKKSVGTSACTPNYNVKHPTMLVPLALISTKQQCEIFCVAPNLHQQGACLSHIN